MVIDRQCTAQLPKFNTPLPEIGPSNAAYMLFTSGSTERPKGIVVEHQNLASSSFSQGGQFKINQSTRVLQFAAYTFDISCADIFITLQRGTTICIPSEYECINDLTSAATKYRADWMSIMPTVAQPIDPESRLLSTLQLIAVLALSNISGRGVPEHEQLKPLRGKDNQAASDQIATIRQLLEERLPDYMIPTVWICVETMTLTRYGKMDGTAVAKWAENFDHEAYQDLLLDSNEYDTKVESAVAVSGQATVIPTLASQVLGIPVIPMNRCFFGLGGDSITAMQLRIKARAAGIDLSVRDILKAKTLFGMAEAATPLNSISPFPIAEIDVP
ncbi:peptide synthetase, partial [Metarhizium brunneum ARSEF 3297]